MFTGHQWDGEAGLYYAPFRYYSPFQARWTTRDPLGMVDGPNVYAYVRGNVVNFIDPYGLYGVGNFAYDVWCGIKGMFGFECDTDPVPTQEEHLTRTLLDAGETALDHSLPGPTQTPGGAATRAALDPQTARGILNTAAYSGGVSRLSLDPENAPISYGTHPNRRKCY